MRTNHIYIKMDPMHPQSVLIRTLMSFFQLENWIIAWTIIGLPTCLKQQCIHMFHWKRFFASLLSFSFSFFFVSTDLINSYCNSSKSMNHSCSQIIVDSLRLVVCTHCRSDFRSRFWICWLTLQCLLNFIVFGASSMFSVHLNTTIEQTERKKIKWSNP